MSKFKVGDRVTAGDRFGGFWADCTVIEVGNFVCACQVRAVNGKNEVGLFKDRELELILEIKDEAYFKAKADEYRRLREEAQKIQAEMKEEGFVLYWKNTPSAQKTTDDLKGYSFVKTIPAVVTKI